MRSTGMSMGIADSDLSRNGVKPVHKPVKAELYAKTVVDKDAGRYRKRHATRQGGSLKQYGMAAGYDHLTMEDFLDGAELPRRMKGGWMVRDQFTKKFLGRAMPAEAMAYRIAAMRVGVMLEVYNDV